MQQEHSCYDGSHKWISKNKINYPGFSISDLRLSLVLFFFFLNLLMCQLNWSRISSHFVSRPHAFRRFQSKKIFKY